MLLYGCVIDHSSVEIKSWVSRFMKSYLLLLLFRVEFFFHFFLSLFFFACFQCLCFVFFDAELLLYAFFFFALVDFRVRVGVFVRTRVNG